MAQPATTQGKPPVPVQAVAGLVPPTVGEALIREAFPTLLGVAAAPAALARTLTKTVFLLPLAWMIQAPLFGLKFAPVLSRRYTLTNRRLMIRKGWKPTPAQEVPLEQIDDVRIAGAVDPFYLSGDLEVISKGQVVLKLPGVPEPEGFRQAIVNAVKAWVPEKAKGAWIPASAKVE